MNDSAVLFLEVVSDLPGDSHILFLLTEVTAELGQIVVNGRNFLSCADVPVFDVLLTFFNTMLHVIHFV